jgi:hypothetical protein
MEEDIRRTCQLFGINREIRILGDYVFSGVFDKSSKCIEQVLELQKQKSTSGVYISLNEVNISPNNAIVPSYKATFPKSENIVERSKFMIDLDPKTEDINHLIKISKSIEDHLYLNGFCQPLIARSGRGIHIIYNVSTPNDTLYNTVFKKVLKYISLQFNDDIVDIDKNVYTANRHAKLYGTITRKNGTERQSYIIQMPDGTVPVDAILKISSNIKDSIIITNSSIVPSGLSKKTKDFIEFGCQQGKRNLELFRSACDFAAKGYNENQAISSLLPPALNSGLDQTEIINTIKSAFAKPRVAQVLTGNYKYEWRGFPFSNHKYAMEFDIRRVTSDTPPWNAFFGETVIKANPGWITESGVAINEGKILGIKFMHLDNALQAKSVAEWLKMIEDGKKCYFLHNN